MKQLTFLMLSVFAFMMCSCNKTEPHIYYSDYIDCSISTAPLVIADSLNSTIQIDLINHSETDLSLKSLYIQINLEDTLTHILYGSSALYNNATNPDLFDLKNNSTVSLSKNMNELFWNTFLKTSELPEGNYYLWVNVATGNLDEAGNAIFSNMISVKKINSRQ